MKPKVMADQTLVGYQSNNPEVTSKMPVFGGAGVVFEGGFSAPPYQETLPTERVSRTVGDHGERIRQTHGVPKAEGLVPTTGGQMEEPDTTSEGFSCKDCGFSARTAHGLARHTHAKHGFGSLGRSIRQAEPPKSQKTTVTAPVGGHGFASAPYVQSSYPSGDSGGAYGHGITRNR